MSTLHSSSGAQDEDAESSNEAKDGSAVSSHTLSENFSASESHGSIPDGSSHGDIDQSSSIAKFISDSPILVYAPKDHSESSSQSSDNSSSLASISNSGHEEGETGESQTGQSHTGESLESKDQVASDQEGHGEIAETNTVPASNDNEESWDVDFGSYDIKQQNIKKMHLALNLLELDPAWLQQFPEQNREKLFFKRVLPLLALRVNELTCELDRRITVLECPSNEWIDKVTEHTFTPENFLDIFSASASEKLTALYRYLILERAKVMYEKLWRECEEWCLLGFAFSCPIESRYSRWDMEPSSLGEVDLAKLADSSYCDVLREVQRIMSQDEMLKCIQDIPPSQPDMGEHTWLAKTILGNYSKFHRVRLIYYNNTITPTTADPRNHPKLRRLVRPDRFHKLAHISSSWEWNGEEVMHDVWRVYQEGPAASDYGTFNGYRSLNWGIISYNVRSFCQYSGIHNLTQDPLENLRKLQMYIVNQNDRDRYLLSQIDTLKDTIRSRELIITSLSYRHLLERLPPAESGLSFETIFKVALKSAEKNTPDSPLRNLAINDKKHHKKMIDHAAKLFGNLSGNIHKYCDWSAVKTDMFGAEVQEIMDAVKPVHFLVDATDSELRGEPDWEEERKRYGIDWGKLITKNQKKKEADQIAKKELKHEKGGLSQKVKQELNKLSKKSKSPKPHKGASSKQKSKDDESVSVDLETSGLFDTPSAAEPEACISASSVPASDLVDMTPSSSDAGSLKPIGQEPEF